MLIKPITRMYSTQENKNKNLRNNRDAFLDKAVKEEKTRGIEYMDYFQSEILLIF